MYQVRISAVMKISGTHECQWQETIKGSSRRSARAAATRFINRGHSKDIDYTDIEKEEFTSYTDCWTINLINPWE